MGNPRDFDSGLKLVATWERDVAVSETTIPLEWPNATRFFWHPPDVFLIGLRSTVGLGGNDATKDRLLKIVPIGATVRDLETEVAARDWRISSRDDRRFTKGESHYFGDGCQFQGGVSRRVVVAE